MISVFARGVTDNLTSLVKKIDEVVGKNSDKKAAAFLVLLSEDVDADAETLSRLAESKGIEHTPLTIFDGVAGPPSYKIAEKAEVTVVMWVGGQVKATHAFAKNKLTAKAIKDIIADTGKILD